MPEAGTGRQGGNPGSGPGTADEEPPGSDGGPGPADEDAQGQPPPVLLPWEAPPSPDYVEGCHCSADGVGYCWRRAFDVVAAHLVGIGVLAADPYPDFDGDGWQEVLVGTLSNAVLGAGFEILSGATGQSLARYVDHVVEVRGQTCGTRHGAALALSSDLDGDGWPEVLAGTYAAGILVWSPGQGQELRRVTDLQGECSEGATGVAARGSVGYVGARVGFGQCGQSEDAWRRCGAEWRRRDAQGVAFGARLFEVDLASGRASLRADMPDAPNASGDILVPVGDLDGDGRPDLLAAGPGPFMPSSDDSRFRVAALSVDGGVLYEVVSAAERWYYDRALVAVGDRDGDGVDDFVAGIGGEDGWPSDPPPDSLPPDAITLFSGATGARIAELRTPNGETEPRGFGRALAWVEEWPGAGGEGRLLAGVPGTRDLQPGDAFVIRVAETGFEVAGRLGDAREFQTLQPEGWSDLVGGYGSSLAAVRGPGPGDLRVLVSAVLDGYCPDRPPGELGEDDRCWQEKLVALDISTCP